VLKGHQEALERAMFSPDGARVITAARDGTARVWNAGSGKQLFVIPLPGRFQTATFNSSGTHVLTASQGSSPVIWDAQTGNKVVAMRDFSQGGYATGAYAAAISPD